MNNPSKQILAEAPEAPSAPVVDPDFLFELMNALPRPVFVKDEQFRFVLVNDLYCDYVGHPADWLIGRTSFEIYAEAEAEIQWAEDVALYVDGMATEREETITGRDGRQRHQLVCKSVFSTANSRRYSVGVIVNISERKQAEAAAVAAQERVERLLASSPAVIYCFAATGDYAPTFISRNLKDLLGYDRAEYLESPDFWHSRVHPDDLQRIEGGFGRLLDEGRLSIEYRFRKQDGSYCWVNDEQFLIRDEKRQPLEVVGSWIDVTERKQAEMELQRHRDHLEQLVAERTRKIEQQSQELEKALEKEKQLTALQREFVAMVSHEFRTPLAIIDGAAQRLLRRLDKLEATDVENRIGKIRSAVMRMTELIESVLSASRLEAGLIDFNPEPCQLGELIRAVCRRQQGISPDHSIEVDVDALPAEFVADSKLLTQVFTNLLSNAVKYAPNRPRIEVRVWGEGDHACVSVKDEGLGIPAAEVPRLFEKFFRAKTSVGISGTGIGLYLIKQLVSLHGGEIAVESDEGKGSTFLLKLPVKGYPG